MTMGQVTPQHPSSTFKQVLKNELICEIIKDDNSLSINMIAREVGIDRKTVLLILRKKLKLYPYKQHDVLDRSDWKKEGRVEFCTWVHKRCAAELTILEDFL